MFETKNNFPKCSNNSINTSGTFEQSNGNFQAVFTLPPFEAWEENINKENK